MQTSTYHNQNIYCYVVCSATYNSRQTDLSFSFEKKKKESLWKRKRNWVKIIDDIDLIEEQMFGK